MTLLHLLLLSLVLSCSFPKDNTHFNQTFIEKQTAFQIQKISRIKYDVLLNQCFKNTELLYFLCFRICNPLYPSPNFVKERCEFMESVSEGQISLDIKAMPMHGEEIGLK